METIHKESRVSNKYVGTEAAAAYLDVTVGMMHVYIREGHITPGKAHARLNYFSKPQLDDFIANGKHTEIVPPKGALIGITEAARYVGCHKRNLRYHTDEGHVAFVDLGKGKRAYTKMELDEFKKEFNPGRRTPLRPRHPEAATPA